MTEALEKKFEKIAEDTIRSAELVDCDGVDFVEGLRTIKALVEHRLECAADEFRE